MAAQSRRTLGAHGTFNLVRGEPTAFRGSIFTAQVMYPIKSAAQAAAAIACMRQEGHCAVADHNMSAYRIKGKTVEKHYDDDGEAHGGQRILGCLTKMGAVNVAVMVSRVYGGENIGKKRFELIVERTSTLLGALGHQPGIGIVHSWGDGHTLGGGAVAAAAAAAVSDERYAVPATSSASSSSERKRKRPMGSGAASSRSVKEDEEAARRAAQREAAALAAERRMTMLGSP